MRNAAAIAASRRSSSGSRPPCMATTLVKEPGVDSGPDLGTGAVPGLADCQCHDRRPGQHQADHRERSVERTALGQPSHQQRPDDEPEVGRGSVQAYGGAFGAGRRQVSGQRRWWDPQQCRRHAETGREQEQRPERGDPAVGGDRKGCG